MLQVKIALAPATHTWLLSPWLTQGVGGHASPQRAAPELPEPLRSQPS